jgi:hypothetical protein
MTFLKRHHKDVDEFYSHNITGGETCVSFVNVETKEQSRQWMHTHSPKKPKKFKQTFSARKLITAVFWDTEGILMVEFMQRGTATASEVYCETEKKTHIGPLGTKDIWCSAPP